MKRRQRPEQQLQRTVFQHVAARCAHDAIVFHVPNGGARSPIEAKIFKGLGVIAGMPDLICIKAGRVFAIELKAKVAKLSPAQEATCMRLNLAGVPVFCSTNLDDVLAYLESHGILKGTAAIKRSAGHDGKAMEGVGA